MTYAPNAPASHATSARQLAHALTEYWSPRVIAQVNDAYVKVAKLKGTLVWHTHADEDELFFVLSGRLRIEMKSGAVQLQTGELFVVPRGVAHNPVADEECEVLLVELRSTLHTGDIIIEGTRTLEEQLADIPVGTP